jgi:hypothetical protein
MVNGCVDIFITRRMGLTPAKATAAQLASRATVIASFLLLRQSAELFTSHAGTSRNIFADTSSMVAVLDAAPFRGPIDKPLHVFAVFPGETEKLARGQFGRFFT